MKSFKGFITETALSRKGLVQRPARPGIFAKKIWGGENIETETGSDIIIKKLTMGGKEYDASVPSDEQKFLDDLPNNYKDLTISDPSTPWSKITKTAEYGGMVGKGPTGAEWESIITHQLNKLLGEEKADTDAIKIASKFYPDYEPIGKKVAQNFQNEFGNNVMTQYGGGGGKGTLSDMWQHPAEGVTGGTNGTPKTDMYTSSYNISLKKKGGSQLASGGKGETIATFYAALEYLGESKSSKEDISGIMDAIQKNFEQVALDYNKTEIEKIAKSKKETESLSKSDQAEIAKFTETEAFHKDLNKKLKTVFAPEKNDEFKKWYVFEAMSGYRKFKKSERKSVASVCVTFDSVGGGLSTINVTTNGSSSGFIGEMKPSKALIDKSKQVKIYSAWKSSGGNPYSTLRLSDYNPTKPDTIPLVDCTLNDIIRDELQNDIEANNVVKTLQEELVMLDEFAIVKKVFGKMKSIGKSALNWVQGFFKKVMAKVKKVFESIKKLGAKMFHAVFEFLGIRVTSVKETHPKEIHGFVYGMAD